MFDALVAKSWIDPEVVTNRLMAEAGVLAGLLRLTETVQDEEVLIQILDMSFLDAIDGSESWTIRELQNLADMDAEAFVRLFSHPEFEEGIVDDQDLSAIKNLFLYAWDEEAAKRILEREWDEYDSDPWVIDRLRRLFEDYPDVFWAFTDNFGNKYLWSTDVIAGIESLSQLDQALAARAASMPFTGEYAGLANDVWRLLRRATALDGEAVSEFLDEYELKGGIEFADQPYAMIDLLEIIDADVAEKPTSFDWVSDSIEESKIEFTERRGPYVS